MPYPYGLDISAMQESLKCREIKHVWKYVVEHDCGIISAYKTTSDYGSGAYTLDKNEGRSSVLKQRLRFHYGIIPLNAYRIEGYGSPSEACIEEEAILVIDLSNRGDLLDELKMLGALFEQDAISFAANEGEHHLISTCDRPEGYPGKGAVGVVQILDSPMFGENNVLHSHVEGRPWIYEVTDNVYWRCIDSATPKLPCIRGYGPTEMRPMHAAANCTPEELLEWANGDNC